MICDELLEKEIPEDNIIYLNFESLRWADLLNSMALYNHLCKEIKPISKTYIFLDEIQEVDNWEKVVNSLMTDFDVDIYITGSNSRMLSSELSTYLTGYMPDMIAGYLENLVYLPLLRKGYKVYVGKSGSLEIDFVAFNGNDTMYIQVTYTMENEETRNREIRPLQQIKDNYPKYVIVADKLLRGNINGIQCVWIGDFLMD